MMIKRSDVVTIMLESRVEAKHLLEEIRQLLLSLGVKSTYDIVADYPTIFELKQTLESELRKE